MDRLTKYDELRKVYTISPDATGNHIQRLGMYEDRDEEMQVIADGEQVRCGKCSMILEEVLHFCSNCGQRLKWK